MAATTPDDGWLGCCQHDGPIRPPSGVSAGAWGRAGRSVVRGVLSIPIAGPSGQSADRCGERFCHHGRRQCDGRPGIRSRISSRKGGLVLANEVGPGRGRPMQHCQRSRIRLIQSYPSWCLTSRPRRTATYNACGERHGVSAVYMGRTARGMDATTAGILGVTDPASIPAAMEQARWGSEGAEAVSEPSVCRPALAGGSCSLAVVRSISCSAPPAGGSARRSLATAARMTRISAASKNWDFADRSGKGRPFSRLSIGAEGDAGQPHCVVCWQRWRRRAATSWTNGRIVLTGPPTTFGGPNSSTTATDVGTRVCASRTPATGLITSSKTPVKPLLAGFQ